MTSRGQTSQGTDFTYRADDRLESVDGSLTGDKLTYHYNALGNLIDITPEQGEGVTCKYDYDTNVADTDLGRLKSITTGSIRLPMTITVLTRSSRSSLGPMAAILIINTMIR